MKGLQFYKSEKKEKGAITLFVLLACLFFVFILTGVYLSLLNRAQVQEQEVQQIHDNYAKDLDRVDEIYEELAKSTIVTLRQDPSNGTWTKDNLYGEITLDTSVTGKAVEKYQYSENGVIWKDIPGKLELNYTTTFPMSGNKPEWISEPKSDSDYYFEIDESTNSLKPNNSGIHNSTAESYFEIDLTDYPEAELEITINATISCEINYYDYGIAAIISEDTEQEIIRVCGETMTDDYTTTIKGGEKYYLYIGYIKDSIDEEAFQDTFTINKITLKSEEIGDGIRFNNYAKTDNKVVFTLNNDIEKEIYLRAVYTDSTTSKYGDKTSIKIDKKEPVIEKAEPVITSKEEAKIEVKATDKGSGLKGYYISTEDTPPTESSNWIEQTMNEFTIEDLITNTTYYLWTIDKVGNISQRQDIVIGIANYLVDYRITTETLAEAITVASDGSIIKLLGDYTDTSTATFNKSVTFDVQSYTLTRSSTITVSSGKTVEITGTGKITSGTSSIYTITNNGTLTVSNSITIENNSTSTSYAPIYNNYSSAIINIDDNVQINGYYRGIYNYNGTLNVNGGKIEATYSSSSAYGIYNYSRTTVKLYINGGEVKGYYGVYNGSSSTMEMTGGKVIGTGAYGVYAYGTTNIYGGRIEGKTYGIYGYSSNKITIGRQEDGLSVTNPAIYGETYGVGMGNSNYNFNFYNGVLIGNTRQTTYNGSIIPRTEYMPYTYFTENDTKYHTILAKAVENITMEATPIEFTNGDVTVTITYPYNNDTKQYSEDGIAWQDADQYMQEVIITENKKVYARTLNESGVVTDEEQIEINNIDKEKPTASVSTTQTNYVVTNSNGTIDLTLTLTANDTGVSRLDKVQYAWAGEGEEIKYIDFESTGTTITKNSLGIGQYNLYFNVTDKAGNKADFQQIRYNVKYEEPVCKIGSITYTTVQAAVDACSKTAGDTQTTIEMLKSTDEEFETYEGQNIILDLKGYTVGSSNAEIPLCINNGTFTLGDNSTEIEYDLPTIYGYKVGIENNNIFNFYDGKIQGITAIQGDATNTPEGYGPVSTGYENEITTVQLGVIEGYEARIEWVYYTKVQEAVNATKKYSNEYKDTVTIIKDIQLKETLEVNENKDIILDLCGYTLTISPGNNTLVNNYGNLEITDSSIEQTGKLTIDSTSNTYGIYNNDIGNIKITGGTINCNSYGIYNSGIGNIIIEGGTVNSASSGIYNNNIGNIQIIGGVINNSGSSGIYNKSTGNVKVIGGTISVHYSGIYNYSTGSIEVTGGIISSNTSGVSSSKGIYNHSSGTVTVTGGNINSSNASGNSYGIYNSNNGNIIIGIKGDEIVSQEEPYIKGEYTGTSTNSVGYGIYNTKGKLYFYDGKIEGTTKAIYELITEYEDKTTLNYNENETILTLSTTLIPVAQIGTTTYLTLEDAINAVGNEQTTIDLLRSIVYTENDKIITIPNTDNIVLNLNGYSITSDMKEKTIENNGILEIIDTSVEQTGTIVATSEETLTNLNGGKLTISSGIIENRTKTVIYNEGELIVSGGNVDSCSNSSNYSYGIYNNSTGSIKVLGGTVNGSSNTINSSYSYGIYNNDEGIIEITSGTVSSVCNSNRYGRSYALYNNSIGNIKITGGLVSSSCIVK